MKRFALALALCGCTPPADTVGAWTTDDGADDPSSSTGVPLDTTSFSDATTSSSSSSSSSSEGSTDDDTTSTGTSAVPPWIATVGSDLALRVLDLDGGMVVEVCTLDGIVEPDALAFLPDGRLVGSHAASASLWVADPCDCVVVPISPPDPVALHALAEREDDPPSIVGVDALRSGLFEVAVDASDLGLVADLADAGAIHAIAAIADSDDVRALVDVGGPHLQRIDGAGVVVQDDTLTIPADASGLANDPDGASLLACDAEGALWRIDPDDGVSEPLPIAWPDSCRTQATPRGTIACIDALLGG